MMEDDIPSKWKLKESGHSYIYIRQNILQAKKGNKRQRRSLCSDRDQYIKKVKQ